jgi:hypothetical protein
MNKKEDKGKMKVFESQAATSNRASQRVTSSHPLTICVRSRLQVAA